MKIFCKKTGYTLIELLVSIGILTMLAAAVAPSISKAKKSQEIQQSALGIKTAINNIQSMALAPPSISDPSTDPIYKYYGLEFGNQTVNSVTSFYYQAIETTCLPITDTDCLHESINEGVPAVSFDTVKMTDPAGGPVYVWFKVGNNPEVKLVGTRAVSGIIIKSKDGNDGRTIKINPITGVVNVTAN